MKICRPYILAFFAYVLCYIPLAGTAQDTEPPVFTSPARDTSFECGIEENLTQKLTDWYNNNAGAQATDNSGAVSFIRIPATIAEAIAQFNESANDNANCGNTQKVTVTFIAVDSTGNQSEPTAATFSTVDTTPPDVNEVSPITFSCVTGIRDTLIHWIQQKGGYEATDLCSEPVIWDLYVYNIIVGNDTISGDGNILNGPYPTIQDGVCNWQINITFSGKDDCDNRFFTPATSFSILDDQPPVFAVLPEDVTVDCNKVPAPANVTATDACTQNITVIFTETSTQNEKPDTCAYNNFIITRTWTAEDSCGNVAVHNQQISVQDMTPPVVLDTAQFLTVSINCLTYRQHPDSIYLNFQDNCSSVNVSFRDTLLTAGCTTKVKRTYLLEDLCGNNSSFGQQLEIIQDAKPVISDKARNLAFECDSQEDVFLALQSWLGDMGGSRATSLCGSLKSFAAVKGSYDINDPATFPGTYPTGLPVTGCPSPIEGFIRYAEVDFVYFDSCGNSTSTTAIFGLRDTLAPFFRNCPEKITVAASPDECMAAISVEVPETFDNCSEKSSPVTKYVKVNVTSLDPPGPDAIVDTVFIAIGPISPFVAEPISGGKLTIKLNSLDIDLPTEYFTIYNEDDVNLGNTPTGAGECDSTFLMLEIPIEDLSRWIQDGYVKYTLIPNIVPDILKASINNICGGSTVEALLTYEIDTSKTLSLFYKINDGPLANADTITDVKAILPQGSNTVTFQASDCARNVRECVVNVEVTDETASVILCPKDTFFVLKPDVCQDTFWLSTDIQVLESCSGNSSTIRTAPANKDAAFISFAYNEAANKLAARNKEFLFTNVPEIYHLDLPVTLTVSFFGNNNAPGKQFEILGPGGVLIGKTMATNDSGCGLSTSVFEIPATLFNQWIENETLTLFAIAENEGLSIQPCRELAAGLQIDSVSYLEASLNIPDVKIMISAAGATSFSETLLSSGQETVPLVLNSGTSTITLTTEDGSGNKASCTFSIDARDDQAPVALCKNSAVTIDPAGLLSTDILPEMIDNGSFDNCGIISYEVSPPNVDCSLAGGDADVFLIVVDEAGNRDSCKAMVRVKSFEIKPTFSAGLCATDTLKLFSNLPPASVPGTYSFHWDGPENIEFFTENPMIPNPDLSYNGVYILTVKGFNECITIGSLVVSINPLLNPKLEANEKEICENTDLILTTTSYTGDITYQWYQGIFPSGVLIASTEVPQYILRPATTGPIFYYAIAKGPDCSSNPSPLLKITVLEKPNAQVDEAFLAPCEGGQIALGSPVVNTGYEYSWTGPAGYTETGRNPRIIENVNSTHAGDYFLVIANKHCLSDTAVTRVEVFERPLQPVISAADIICEGSIFSAVATGSPNSERFQWFRDGVLITTTQQNNIIFTNAGTALQGLWTVVSFKGNCQSLPSSGKFIAIDMRLEVGITNNGPVCTGDSLMLQATFVPNATYKWAGPVSNIPSIPNPIIRGVPGDYSVTITTPTGCENNASTVVETIEAPAITALSNDSKSCMNKQDIIRFYPTVFPSGAGFTYDWIRPDGSITNSSSLSLSDLNSAMVGIYKLVVKNQGCPSDTAATEVAFTIIPEIPLVSADPYYCEGDTIRLQISPAEALVQYNWNTPLGQVNTGMTKLEIPNVSGLNSGSYSVAAVRNGCSSSFSIPVNVEVRKRPDVPVISANAPVCFGAELKLSGPTIPDVLYRWILPDKSTLQNKVYVVEKAGIKDEGRYILSATLNGCSALASDTITIDVLDEIKVPEFLMQSIALCTTQEGGAEVCIDPESLHPGAQYELINQVNGEILGTGNGNCIILDQNDDLSQGSNFIIARSRVGNCVSEVSAPIVISLNTPPNVNAEAFENDLILCEGEGARLTSRFGPPLVNLRWRALSASNIISEETAITTLVTGLDPGDNTVFLEYSIAGCPSFSRDTINIYVDFTPNTQNDTFFLKFPESTWLNILSNDVIPDRAKLSIIRQPQLGTAILENGGIRYTPDPRYPEAQQIVYRVCADFCDELCKEAVVFIRYQDDIECRPPTIITPNEDGINDLFIVPCLGTGKYPNNSLVVFNEWGQEVFYAKPYANNWGGTFGNSPLPVGTYFYVFQTDEDSRPINGFLIIQR